MGEVIGGPPACFVPIYRTSFMRTSCESCEYRENCVNRGML